MRPCAGHSVWDTLHQAIESLKTSLAGPGAIQTNIFLLPPVDRDEARRTLMDREEVLLQGIRELKKVEMELDCLRSSLENSVARVRSWLAPIALLPAEILLEIFDYATNPRWALQTLNMSSVCKLWRDVLHAHRILWSEADWNAWHPRLLELWIQRASGHPLTVRLDLDGVSRISRWARMTEGTKKTWKVLDLDIRASNPGQRAATSITLDRTKMLLRGELPFLQTFRFIGPMPLMMPEHTAPRTEGINLSTPSLKFLTWSGSFPLILADPLPQLCTADIEITEWHHWPPWVSILAASPLLSCLSIRVSFPDISTVPTKPAASTRIVLHSLRFLTLQSFRGASLAYCFEHWSMPETIRVEIQDHWSWSRGAYSEVLRRLTRMAPQTSSLAFHPSKGRLIGRHTALLDTLTGEAASIPHLRELNILYDRSIRHYEMDVDSLCGFISARGIRTLALPAGWHTLAGTLKQVFDYLQVEVKTGDFFAST